MNIDELKKLAGLTKKAMNPPMGETSTHCTRIKR